MANYIGKIAASCTVSAAQYVTAMNEAAREVAASADTISKKP
jgi:hypothetical protein